MTKTNIKSEEAQGALTQEVNEKINKVTVEQVEKWMMDDLGRALSLLHAIQNDKNILRLMSIHMHGLVQNWNNGKASIEKLNKEED